MKNIQLDRPSPVEHPARPAKVPAEKRCPTDLEIDGMNARPMEMRERLRPIPTAANQLYLDLECLADIPVEPREPVWGSVLSKGAVTVLAGEPGIGKSLLALQIAAAVTRGEVGPQTAFSAKSNEDSPGEPLGVLICTPHYERSNTLARRLVAAKADLSLVQTIHGIRELNDLRKDGRCWSFQLDRDLAVLESELPLFQATEANIGLVVIDPFPDTVMSGSRHAKKLQELTARLAELAVICQVAVLLVCEALPLDNPARATSITAHPAVEQVAHSVWVIERDRHSASDRLLLPAKSTDEADPLALALSLRDGCVTWNPEPLALTAQQFRSIALQRNRDPLLLEDASELARATDWLEAHLAAGPVCSASIKQAAQDNEISPATLRRAFCTLRCTSTRITGTRHHSWAATGGLHARRVMGSEWEGRARVADFDGLELERLRGLEARGQSGDTGLNRVEPSSPTEILPASAQAKLEAVPASTTDVPVTARLLNADSGDDRAARKDAQCPSSNDDLEDLSVASALIKPMENGSRHQVCVHDEHVLEHQSEHVLPPEKQGVSTDFTLAVHAAPQN